MKKTTLLILAITSLICSRTVFFIFNDPEGPNLLVVVVLAAILFVPSLVTYKFYPSTKADKGVVRILLGVLIQLIVSVGLYSLM
jgi:uncharacterized membrane-anchored protein